MTARYTPPAVVLHWLIALLIFVAFPLGLYMHDLPLSPTKLQLYSYHKWIGITVLLAWPGARRTPRPRCRREWARCSARRAMPCTVCSIC